MSIAFFAVIAAISIAAAIGVISSRQPVHSALFLLTNFATLAILYVTLEAQFLAAVQIIIYAGGIVILILFVIMLLGSEDIPADESRPWTAYAGIVLGIIMLGGIATGTMGSFSDTDTPTKTVFIADGVELTADEIAAIVDTTELTAEEAESLVDNEEIITDDEVITISVLEGGTPKAVGMELFTKYLLPFEMTAILILVALLGALLLGRRPRAGEAESQIAELEQLPESGE